MRDHLREQDSAGPSAFRLLLRPLSDQRGAFEKLQAFGVPSGTFCSIYPRALRELTSVVQGSKKVVKLSDAMAPEVVRTSDSKKFLALTPVLYPGNRRLR